ncbi:HTTM domain-containing protein [Halovivax cerinus]|uniref:HTTM domain-containing protein n=1 Tax=Halovivax cerinus TaxID=1487865 RepID=A0ABD5NJ54_9EURY|nr:HTTM domain-containing protein [Halovivax cerinus]
MAGIQSDGWFDVGASVRSRVPSAVTARLGIDIRAIAAYRIGLGLVALFDLLVFRVPGIGTFYTDRGVLPRSTLAEVSPALVRWSLHAVSGAAWVQAVLMGITVLVAGCVLVGYRSRIASVLLASLLISMYARNPYLVNGGDTVLISLLALAAFLPLDGRWAVRPRGPRPTDRFSAGSNRYVSTATAVLLVHVVVIYAINAALKFQSDAWMRGVAVRQIFGLAELVYLLGPALAASPGVLTVINWLWIGTLTASVGLIVFTGRLRIAIVGAYVGAHLGMALTMQLGAFPFVMIVAVCPYLPSGVWDPVDRFVSDRIQNTGLGTITDREGGTPRSRRVPSPDLPPAVHTGARVATAAALVSSLVVVGGWQLVAADVVETPAVDDEGPLASASWAFFAPNPQSTSHWYVASATTSSGATVDLVTGDPATFDRPADAMDRYPSTLWRRYGSKARGAGDAVAGAAVAYACDRAPSDVESVTLYRVDQSVDANGPVGAPIPHELATRSCR